MKKTFYIITLISFFAIFCSCQQENPCQIQTSIDELHKQADKANSDLNDVTIKYNYTSAKYQELKEQCAIMDAHLKGKEPKYILKLKLKQSHFTMSIRKMVKDHMNTAEFEIPVDKQYYDNVREGQEIVDKFRVGSAILYGSFGDWEVTVLEKRVQI